MNCEEKAMKARLEADHGVEVRRVRIVRGGGRVRVRVSLAEPREFVITPELGEVRRGVLRVRVG